MAPIPKHRKKKSPVILALPVPIPLAVASTPVPLVAVLAPIVPLPKAPAPVPAVAGMVSPPLLALILAVVGRAPPPQARALRYHTEVDKLKFKLK